VVADEAQDLTLAEGIHLVHKAVGTTSFLQVQRFLRQRDARPASAKRLPICHGGTLDPFAEGLLLILVGPAATRLFPLLHEVPKRYVAQVVWGKETDTGDAGGRVVATGDPKVLSPPALDAALAGFKGWTAQVPPATSAKKIAGEPAYRKAHRGEAVELPPSNVYLHEARWLSHDLPERSQLWLECRGGYYVRALARDLGRALGARAHLCALRREAIGPWTDPGPEEQPGKIISGTELLPWLPSRALSDAEVGALRRGGTISVGRVEKASWPLPDGFPAPDPLVRAFHQGRLVALLQQEPSGLQVKLDLRRGV
jgi:tRNA pseudouridine55 synthase